MIIKGRYVAQIAIDLDYPDSKEFKPFEEIRKDLTTGVLTEVIREMLVEEVGFPIGTKLTVTQQCADLYRAEEVEDDGP